MTPELEKKVSDALNYLIETTEKAKKPIQSRGFSSALTAAPKTKGDPLDEVEIHIKRQRAQSLDGREIAALKYLGALAEHAHQLGHYDVALPYDADGSVDYEALEKALKDKISQTLQAVQFVRLIDMDSDVKQAFKNDERVGKFRDWVSTRTLTPEPRTEDSELRSRFQFASNLLDALRKQDPSNELCAFPPGYPSAPSLMETFSAGRKKTKRTFSIAKIFSAMAQRRQEKSLINDAIPISSIEESLLYMDAILKREKKILKKRKLTNIQEARRAIAGMPNLTFLSRSGQPYHTGEGAASDEEKLKIDLLQKMEFLEKLHVHDVGFKFESTASGPCIKDTEGLIERVSTHIHNLRKSHDLMRYLITDAEKSAKTLQDPRFDKIATAFMGTDIGETARRILALRPTPVEETATPPTSASAYSATATASSASTDTADTTTEPPLKATGASSDESFKTVYEQWMSEQAERAAKRKTFRTAAQSVFTGAWGKIKGLAPSRNPFKRNKSGPAPKGTS